MNFGLLILLLLIILVVVAWYLQRANGNGTATADSASGSPSSLVSPSEKEPVFSWWEQLPSDLQFDLAIFLAGYTLEVWNKYTDGHALTWRNSTSSPWVRLDPFLLTRTLQSLRVAVNGHERRAGQSIRALMEEFIDPVVALQDGTWSTDYPVKKCLLAIYNLLKSVIEKDEATADHGLYSLSIGQLLDCLDLSGLYSADEIENLLTVWKKSHNPGSLASGIPV
ncbi:MAG: hypothetical protein EOO05_13400 [Chitinophagaceae bacterium]|nr:MAG: hypothetical protein EOO05_13400 [Chitinophagaceae bacterium]